MKPPKKIEDTAVVVGMNADTVVLDLEDNLVGVARGAGTHHNLTIVAGILRSVGKQIRENLGNKCLISVDERELTLYLDPPGVL